MAGARERVEALTQAVLAKAFRGELVPTEAELAWREGREYEPAGALLERVRAGREDKPSKRNRCPTVQADICNELKNKSTNIDFCLCGINYSDMRESTFTPR